MADVVTLDPAHDETLDPAHDDPSQHPVCSCWRRFELIWDGRICYASILNTGNTVS